MSEGWRETPLELTVDLEHGGRWTSLRADDREWLWTNPDASIGERRPAVEPGEAFVDAGGVEECFPTVRGVPDHGDVWCRPWTGDHGAAGVSVAGLGRLHREVRSDGGSIMIDYMISGEPGVRFVHAVHALLDLSPTAYVVVREATSMTVLDVADADRPWPSGLDRLGPDDATAICALVPDCHEATVIDGRHALRLSWAAADQPDLCSLLLWRNLRGWPAENPYRSIGIEPMVGRTAELTGPGDVDAARVPADGRFAWRLVLTAFAR